MKAAVYTRTGDKGTTGLYTGERVPKQSMRVEAYGTVDEISSALGLARATVRREDVRETIYKVQQLLMSLMADIASLNLPEPYIKAENVKTFEDTIDKFDAMLQPLSPFYHPRRHPRISCSGYSAYNYAPCRALSAPSGRNRRGQPASTYLPEPPF